MLSPSFRQIYEFLAATVPCGQWWPAQSAFEIVVGAVLTQNTAWTNVEYAIENLRQANLLDPEALLATSVEEVAILIRPSGYMNVKARYVHNVSAWFHSTHELAASMETPQLRTSLLGVTGVGPETADDIVLYVYDRPVFIWDAYGRRLLSHVGYSVPSTYEAARRALEGQVASCRFTAMELQHFHGLIVEAGKMATRSGGYEAVLAGMSAEKA